MSRNDSPPDADAGPVGWAVGRQTIPLTVLRDAVIAESWRWQGDPRVEAAAGRFVRRLNERIGQGVEQSRPTPQAGVGVLIDVPPFVPSLFTGAAS